jgi:hypothetical protein
MIRVQRMEKWCPENSGYHYLIFLFPNVDNFTSSKKRQASSQMMQLAFPAQTDGFAVITRVPDFRDALVCMTLQSQRPQRQLVYRPSPVLATPSLSYGYPAHRTKIKRTRRAGGARFRPPRQDRITY